MTFSIEPKDQKDTKRPKGQEKSLKRKTKVEILAPTPKMDSLSTGCKEKKTHSRL